jgi:hypothetical protein
MLTNISTGPWTNGTGRLAFIGHREQFPTVVKPGMETRVPPQQ